MAFFTDIVEALQSIETTLSQSNETSWWLVIATISLVIATIFLSVATLLKSSSIQQSTHYERMRPWIVISSPKPSQVVYENGSVINWEAHNSISLPDRLPVKNVRITLEYTNHGLVSPTNLKEIEFTSDQPILKSDLEKMSEKNLPMALVPQQSQNKILTVSWERWRQISSTPLYIALRISYDTSRARGVSGAIYKMTKGMSEITETWAT